MLPGRSDPLSRLLPAIPLTFHWRNRHRGDAHACIAHARSAYPANLGDAHARVFTTCIVLHAHRVSPYNADCFDLDQRLLLPRATLVASNWDKKNKHSVFTILNNEHHPTRPILMFYHYVYYSNNHIVKFTFSRDATHKEKFSSVSVTRKH